MTNTLSTKNYPWTQSADDDFIEHGNNCELCNTLSKYLAMNKDVRFLLKRASWSHIMCKEFIHTLLIMLIGLC